MVSFELANPGWVPAFKAHLQLIIPAVSLGGTESLITEPFRETHRELPEALRLKLGITPGLMRFSAGIEDTDDLVTDLVEALDALP